MVPVDHPCVCDASLLSNSSVLGSFYLPCGVYCLHLEWDFQWTLGALTIITEV